ncbi:hypothetical protein LEP1GSC050_3092 [Leptospira broomii serovar Hurstbridge str. 5399]|uniref:Phage neck terminator protein gp12-like domain-containing protein n=1 Tax=Leptospira broomii serovar Hurstbridge str. 5399 TaxID=1049789 RepID=T0FC07_9LEPT|nr:hypothetical protein [Leptospira broomii]EQA45416.1 hypothetical protein LEP1GSC050_3092 [Leptospira broomii serovar Hurstbridge str. 5399]
MIPLTVLHTIFNRIQVSTSVTLAQFDQTGLTFPYGTYRVTSSVYESSYQNVETRAAKVGDPTTVVTTKFERYRDTISLNFFSNSSVDIAWQSAGKIISWFSVDDNRDFCKAQGIVPRLTNPVIQDFSFVHGQNQGQGQGTIWTYQVGFDLRFDYVNQSISEVEGISKIKIQEQFGNHNHTTTIGV